MAEEKNSEVVRTQAFWGNQWTAGDIGWHCDQVHPQLIAHAHLLLPRPEKHRVFVPLCGKTLDLMWLYKEGHRVVGVDFVEKSVQDFGTEHGIQFLVSQLPWGKLYQTSDHRLQIYVCNFFEMPVHEIGKFDAVWDRGSVVAIDETLRPRYATLLKNMLLPHFRYLMALMDYTPTADWSGPPSPVPTHYVDEQFGEVAQWKLMQTIDYTEAQGFKELGITNAVESFLLLTPKQNTR